MSPKKVVGCRGGRQNAEGVLVIPLLANRKVGKNSFHAFDRYEIHIQPFVDFIDAKAIIFKSSSPQNYFYNI